MALRNQPYLPLYVQDVLTDEKLMECSAEAHGIYFRLLCILHKQETYGLICLKQKYKQSENKIVCFASMLVKQLPFGIKQIQDSLTELVEEGVLQLEDDNLLQKRMFKDGNISIMRSSNGKKGGSNVTKQYGKKGFLYLMSDGFLKTKIGISVNPQNRLYRVRSDNKLPKHFDIIEVISVDNMGEAEDLAHVFFEEIIDGEWLIGEFNLIIKKFDLFKAKIKANSQANSQANSENESDNESDNENKIEIGKESLREKPKIPFEEIIEIFNSVCIDLPRVEKITELRKKNIESRVKENSLEVLGDVFRQVSESDFLCGKKTDFKASFDWIMKPANFVKILEGNYKNNKNGTGEKSNAELFSNAMQSETAKNFRFK